VDFSGAVVGTREARTWVNHADIRVEPAGGARLANDGVVGLFLRCDKGHTFTVEAVANDGAITVITAWEVEGERDAD